MRRRLAEKGYEPSLIGDIVSELKRLGDIDDTKFARFWMESRMYSNPVGAALLRQELRGKGVGDDIIDATVEARAKAYDDLEVALRMARDRYERFKNLDRTKASKRLYDFLMRRGFGYETVRSVIEKLTHGL